MDKSLSEMRNWLKRIKVSLTLVILLLAFGFNNAIAETSVEKDTFILEVRDNLINLKAEGANFKEILRELEEKTEIKVEIFEGVEDKEVSLDIKALPIYAVGTILEKMALKNFVVLYDKLTRLLV